MALLCLNFRLQAQENKAVDVTLKGIQIGQKVPDVTVTNLHNYKDANGKPATTAKLSDFKGKLLILDFWATWCSPCVAMIPKMDSLQKAFGDKIQFLSVTYQTEKEVLPFLEKFEKQQGKHYDLPVITSSKQLHQLFPHTTLPHYVWIDGNGNVSAITRMDELTYINISHLLTQNSITLAEKKDQVPVKYDKRIPFLIDGNGGNHNDLIYHSIIAKYSGKLKSGYNVQYDKGTGWKITAFDLSLLQLFKLAYGMNRNHLNNSTIVNNLRQPNDITSSLRGDEYLDWKKNHAYSYELVVPPTTSGEEAFINMQDDLKRLFNKFSVKEEIQKRPCYALERTDQESSFLSKGGSSLTEFSQTNMALQNTTISLFIAKLNSSYQQKAKYPLVDDTGIIENVDIKITANLTDINSINDGLRSYGLQFIERKKDVKVLVIADND